MATQGGETAPGRVDTGLFALAIAFLLFLAGFNGLLIGWGWHWAEAAAGTAHPNDQMIFFHHILLVMAPVLVLNALAAALVVRRFLRPLDRIRRTMLEVARGNLEDDTVAAPGEPLTLYEAARFEMLDTLRRLVYRDHDHAREAMALLKESRDLIAHLQGVDAEQRGRLESMLDSARSRLSIVNEHFLKGRPGRP